MDDRDMGLKNDINFTNRIEGEKHYFSNHSNILEKIANMVGRDFDEINIHQHTKYKKDEVINSIKWNISGQQHQKITFVNFENQEIEYLDKIKKYIKCIENNFENKSLVLREYIKLKNELRNLEEYAAKEKLVNISRVAMIIGDALNNYNAEDLTMLQLSVVKNAVFALSDINITKKDVLKIDKALRDNSLNWVRELGGSHE